MGNLLLITPLLAGVRQAFDQARIDVLVSAESFPDIYTAQSFVDDVVLAPKKAMARNPLRTLAFSKFLREKKYDLIFDASHMHEFSLTNAWAARLTQAPWRVGYRRGDADLFLNVLLDAPQAVHECEIHLHLLRAILPGFEPRRETPVFEPSPDERKHARVRAAELGMDSETIGIFVGARGRKKLAVEMFAELAELLHAQGRSVALFGGPAEHVELANIQTRARIVPVLEVREFAALMQTCRVVVSADTGPMHLAVAVGVPTVELFVASDVLRYGYGHLPGHTTLTGEAITLDNILAAVDTLAARKELA